MIPIPLPIAQAYVRLQILLKRNFRLNLRGGGRLLGLVRKDALLTIQGFRLCFDHRIAPSYAWLAGGEYNEPETHLFMRLLLDRFSGDVEFVDVGANLGEMCLDFARLPGVRRVVGFEPQRECCDVIERSAARNGFPNLEVRCKAISSRKGLGCIVGSGLSTSASSIELGNSREQQLGSVEVSTLDDELPDLCGNLVLLIDVEGAEPEVLKGAANLISRNKPLILFEYNETSKRHYHLSEIREILGPEYAIYKLLSDGFLSEVLEKTWNCVAVSTQSPFLDAINSMVVR